MRYFTPPQLTGILDDHQPAVNQVLFCVFGLAIRQARGQGSPVLVLVEGRLIIVTLCSVLPFRPVALHAGFERGPGLG